MTIPEHNYSYMFNFEQVQGWEAGEGLCPWPWFGCSLCMPTLQICCCLRITAACQIYEEEKNTQNFTFYPGLACTLNCKDVSLDLTVLSCGVAKCPLSISSVCKHCECKDLWLSSCVLFSVLQTGTN